MYNEKTRQLLAEIFGPVTTENEMEIVLNNFLGAYQEKGQAIVDELVSDSERFFTESKEKEEVARAYKKRADDFQKLLVEIKWPLKNG